MKNKLTVALLIAVALFSGIGSVAIWEISKPQSVEAARPLPCASPEGCMPREPDKTENCDMWYSKAKQLISTSQGIVSATQSIAYSFLNQNCEARNKR